MWMKACDHKKVALISTELFPYYINKPHFDNKFLVRRIRKTSIFASLKKDKGLLSKEDINRLFYEKKLHYFIHSSIIIRFLYERITRI